MTESLPGPSEADPLPINLHKRQFTAQNVTALMTKQRGSPQRYPRRYPPYPPNTHTPSLGYGRDTQARGTVGRGGGAMVDTVLGEDTPGYRGAPGLGISAPPLCPQVESGRVTQRGSEEEVEPEARERKATTRGRRRRRMLLRRAWAFSAQEMVTFPNHPEGGPLPKAAKNMVSS
jgi:hypothetical protein